MYVLDTYVPARMRMYVQLLLLEHRRSEISIVKTFTANSSNAQTLNYA